MELRITGFGVLVAAAMAALASTPGCQSAQKPASHLVVPKPPAPPIQASTPAPPKPQTQQPTVLRPAEPTRETVPLKPDAVAERIRAVEKEYQSGVEQYQAGEKDAAREHFDRAFKLLLDTPAELRSDPRFQPEFDRIMDGVNQLEISAQNDNRAEQKAEPAPIDEANEVNNYPVDPHLKAQAAAEIKATHSDLPLMMTDQVAGYITYFSSRGRSTLEHGLERSGRYHEMIGRILKEEGVPQDLIYLAQAESGFHPYAVSRAGARGIWQFMASRARAYDLHRDFWVDERQDPEKSTRAAARHLKELYNQFGDWYLAMAAYNSGPGTVQSAVKHTGYADFWELYRRNVLPHETRNYVPIILAVTIMAKNPAQYGLDAVVRDPEVAYDTVKINYPVNLRLVAECVDRAVEELEELNPSLLRMTIPKTRFELHLPAGTAEKYQTAIAAIPPAMRLWWRYRTVVPGDTLMSIARAYRTPMRSIAQANQLEMSATLEPGRKLVIPLAPTKRGGDLENYAKRLTIYHVRRNDTVQSVSDNLGIPASTIRRWNRLKGDSLAGRRVLYIHLPVSPGALRSASPGGAKPNSGSHLQASETKPFIRHRVRRGETLYSIANSYKTTVARIKQTNAHLATLRPGMVLVIPAQ
jgi:membrane-bound lytic murein transglycosylase D